MLIWKISISICWYVHVMSVIGMMQVLEFLFGMKLFPCLQLLPICKLQVGVVSGP